MSRYTYKNLKSDVAELNAKLEKLNHEFRFDVGSSYNRTTIDLATPEQLARHCCDRLLDCGTPRECLAACHAYLAKLI